MRDGARRTQRLAEAFPRGVRDKSLRSLLRCDLYAYQREGALFAGVLDGGEREVFLGGSRLSRFIDTVEKATATPHSPTERRIVSQIPSPMEKSGERVASVAPVSADVSADVWAPLIQTGLTLLEQFADALRPASPGGRTGLSLVHRDPHTGQDYLRIPLPQRDVLDRVLQSIGAFLAQAGNLR